MALKATRIQAARKKRMEGKRNMYTILAVKQNSLFYGSIRGLKRETGNSVKGLSALFYQKPDKQPQIIDQFFWYGTLRDLTDNNDGHLDPDFNYEQWIDKPFHTTTYRRTMYALDFQREICAWWEQFHPEQPGRDHLDVIKHLGYLAIPEQLLRLTKKRQTMTTSLKEHLQRSLPELLTDTEELSINKEEKDLKRNFAYAGPRFPHDLCEDARRIQTYTKYGHSHGDGFRHSENAVAAPLTTTLPEELPSWMHEFLRKQTT